MRFITLALTFTLLFTTLASAQSDHTSGEAPRWSIEKANSWYAKQPWYTGFNYAPGYAINQIEMWQEDTFDPQAIDRELGWAEDIGFTMARVYLHNLLWDQDKIGFVKRIDQFLEIADKHNIKIMMILFDDVWDPAPHLGKQRSPIPHTHNSGWVQGPGRDILQDLNRHDELEDYVRGILARYANDDRIAIWDLYNEPGNTNDNTYSTREPPRKAFHSLQLLKKVFFWARDENPSQPITSGIWRSRDGKWNGANPESKVKGLYDFMVENSDIITFHSYNGIQDTTSLIKETAKLGRPMICTEYMARPYSTFEEIMPLFAEHKIGAINWGFIAGKSQTNYPWPSWGKTFHTEPTPWFHDILRMDGTAYSAEEVKFIKSLIKQTK